MIRFGICTDPFHAPVLAAQGYDYLECAISALGLMEAGSYDELAERMKASPLKAEAGNLLLPGGTRLTGEQADLEDACAKLAVSLPRFARLGGKVAVFGSGGARAVPEGFARESAMEQLAEFCRRAGAICGEYGLLLAIEPLNRKECNIVNSVVEALELAVACGDSRVGALADWYHVAVENEGTEGIAAAGNRLYHCHIARPDGRAYPHPSDPDCSGYEAFFAALCAIGYQGRVSVEGRGEPARDGALALAALRRFARC